MLAFPRDYKNPALDMSSYNIAVQSLKLNFDIDLIIDIVPTTQVTDYSGFLKSLLRYNSSEYDIYQIDVVWPGDLGEKFLDLAPYIPDSLKAIHNPGIYNANNIQGKQVAVPFYADYGILYYRTDLLEKYNISQPPETWDEMEQIMEKIVPFEKATNPSFSGYVGQLNAYEGLTCNFVEWIASNDGGYVVDQYNLSITVNNRNAVDIIRKMQSWLSPSKAYSPLASLTFTEPQTETHGCRVKLNLHPIPDIKHESSETRSFSVIGQDLSAFGVTRLPGKHRNMSAATLGGFQLAVNKFTRDVNASIKAIQAMMTPEFQMQRLNTVGVMPTIPAIFKDPAFCALRPECKVLETLQVAARPSAAMSPKYLAGSQEIYIRVNRILRGDASAEEGIRELSIAIAKTLGRYQDPSSLLGPPEFVDWSKPAAIAFMTIASLNMFLTIILFILILLFRTHRAFSAASPIFLLMMVSGTFLGHAAIFVYTGMPTNLKCILQPWLVVGGYSITLSANTFSLTPLNNMELLKSCGYLNALNVFLLLLWTFFTPQQPSIVLLKDTHFWTCQTRHDQTGWIIIGILFAYNAMILGAAVFLTSKTKKVQGPFNETRFIMYAVYTMVFVDVILVPLSFVDAVGVMFQYIFRCLAIELSCLAIAYHLFMPKLMALLWNSDVDEMQVIQYHENSPHSQLDSVMFGVERQSSVVAASRLPVGIRETVQEKNHTVHSSWRCLRSLVDREMVYRIHIMAVRSASHHPHHAHHVSLHASKQPTSYTTRQEDLGVAVEVRTIVFDEVEARNEEFIQVGSKALRGFWMDVIVGMAVIATTSGSKALRIVGMAMIATTRKGVEGNKFRCDPSSRR
ncbi:hypothetical protein BC829DRAFT_440237 [Chytridium lagenaria]|nr:hypothetical protein BC829DRAFT_440237 [Chytridium lagenaria]